MHQVCLRSLPAAERHLQTTRGAHGECFASYAEAAYHFSTCCSGAINVQRRLPGHASLTLKATLGTNETESKGEHALVSHRLIDLTK